MCPESGLRTAPNWPEIRKMTMTSQFSETTSTSNFFDVVLFLLSSLVTGLSFMSVSSLVLELWQLSFIRDWPEIRKSEIPQSETGRQGRAMDTKFGTSVSNRMLLNAAKFQGTALTVFELSRENQLGGGGVKLPPPPPPKLVLRNFYLNNTIPRVV